VKLIPTAVVVALLALSAGAARGQTEPECGSPEATELLVGLLRTTINSDDTLPPFPSMGDLSFRGFAQEVFVPYATSRTTRFDDDLQGRSYQVDPAAVAAALPAEATHYGLELRALSIMRGSALGGHEIVAFLREKDCTRVTSVTVVHRVLEKLSGCVPEAEVSRALEALRATATKLTAGAREQTPLDSGCILLWEYGPGTAAASPPGASCFGERPGVDYEGLKTSLEVVMSRLTRTYSRHYPPWRE
jgi:hypothetical protein